MDIHEIAGCTGLRLRRAARRATQIYDRALAPAGLTVTQLGVLAYLYGNDAETGAGLSINGLSERLGMDPTTLNRSLKPLEVVGMVSSAAAQDRRVRMVMISELGRARLQQAAPLWRQAQDQVSRRLGHETTLALNGLLELSAARLAE